jgi:hypothetical protein
MIAVILSVHLDDSSRDQFKVNIAPEINLSSHFAWIHDVDSYT